MGRPVPCPGLRPQECCFHCMAGTVSGARGITFFVLCSVLFCFVLFCSVCAVFATCLHLELLSVTCATTAAVLQGCRLQEAPFSIA